MGLRYNMAVAKYFRPKACPRFSNNSIRTFRRQIFVLSSELDVERGHAVFAKENVHLSVGFGRRNDCLAHCAIAVAFSSLTIIVMHEGTAVVVFEVQLLAWCCF